MTPEPRRIQIEPQAWMTAAASRRLLEVLAAAGGEGRFVGGCVRDALAGRPVKDVDIATPLRPEAVLRACEAAGFKVVPTGLQHGTVTVIVEHRPHEVTTLRRDLETDGRHAVVAFTDDWRADAARRDLTMNALFCDGAGLVTDYFGGVADLAAGRVRFVGEARRRIEEDYLRLLRFFRFQAYYGRGEPDAEGLAAAIELAPGLKRISAERKRDELLRLLAAPDPVPVLRLMQESGVLFQVLPGWRFYPEELAALVPLTEDPLVRLASLLDTHEALYWGDDVLRLSKAQQTRLAFLLEPPFEFEELETEAGIRRCLFRHGPDAIRETALLLRAQDILTAKQQAKVEAAALAWEPRVFPLRGQDLIDLGMRPGPKVGRLMRALEDWWLEQDFKPDREALLARAKLPSPPEGEGGGEAAG